MRWASAAAGSRCVVCGVDGYPARVIADAISSGRTRPGSNSTTARPRARFTSALLTPGSDSAALPTWATHDAQSMPVTSRTHWSDAESVMARHSMHRKTKNPPSKLDGRWGSFGFDDESYSSFFTYFSGSFSNSSWQSLQQKPIVLPL